MASALTAPMPMLEYSGMNRRMSCPCECRYCGRALATSARPPVLARGAISDATKQIRMGIRLTGEAMEGSGMMAKAYDGRHPYGTNLRHARHSTQGTHGT